ncbi:hypothetical protein [Paenibacillus sp. YYML68]|nr:hypothetical protein [Paenibacillus sp. YYML68]
MHQPYVRLISNDKRAMSSNDSSKKKSEVSGVLSIGLFVRSG